MRLTLESQAEQLEVLVPEDSGVLADVEGALARAPMVRVLYQQNKQ